MKGKNSAVAAIFFLVLLGFSLSPNTYHLKPAFGAVEMPASSYLDGLTWLGHASFKLVRGGATVYFDPWRLSGEPHDADFVLISHPHFDHFSPADVAKVSDGHTAILTVAEVADQLSEAREKLLEEGVVLEGNVLVIQPGEKKRMPLKSGGSILIEAVPAYNTDKQFHLKKAGWAGFIVTLDGVRIYHAGDTDKIPEMGTFKTDVALLPVSGTYVMTAAEAAQAAEAIQPRVAVPMHYGSIVGSQADAKRFEELCGSIIVEILEKSGER